MDAGSQRVLDYLTEVEEAAEEVITTKQQVCCDEPQIVSFFKSHV